MSDPWEGDLLGHQDIGKTFTNLVKSIETTKVISIEAGFGRGKTFFRNAWAQHLRQEGEVVVELDGQQSDHSGDPVVSLLGALVHAIPTTAESKGKASLEAARKFGAIGVRAVTRAVLKSGAEEVIDALSDSAIDALDDFDTLDGVVKDLGNEMSKVAGQIIASQMAAERVRTDELPQQLEALRAALVHGSTGDRVVVIVDELDRCHPDYAISFLEAMKLVFDQRGFVFCLMVNADYLENLAQHRFGVSDGDEKYLDKFVDIRLRLDPKGDIFKTAVEGLTRALPLAIPYGDDPAFSLDHAAEMTGKLAQHTDASLRRVKRILLKVELALRCYRDHPLDVSLLILMAFQDETGTLLGQEFLPRSFLSPKEGEKQMTAHSKAAFKSFKVGEKSANQMLRIIHSKGPELSTLPWDRYKLPEKKDYHDYARVFRFLAPHYLPSHRAVLNAVASVIAPAQ